MSPKYKSVLEQVLLMNAVERARLLEAIYRSLGTIGDTEYDRLWIAEADSRVEAYKKGELKTESAEAVFEEAANR